MEVASPKFKSNAREALLNETLQGALKNSRGGFVDKRLAAVEDFPQFDELRDRAVAIKNHVLTNLDHYLDQFAEQVANVGGQVHFARTPEDGVETIINICKQAGASVLQKVNR